MKLINRQWCGIAAATLLLAALSYAQTPPGDDSCGDCGGDGLVEGDCYWCKGDGWESSTMTFYEKCDWCRGTGEKDCGDCKGTKYEAGTGTKCYSCDGTGIEGDCGNCSGDGEVNEDSYDVVEPCGSCTEGKVEQMCGTCNGTGSAPWDGDPPPDYDDEPPQDPPPPPDEPSPIEPRWE